MMPVGKPAPNNRRSTMLAIIGKVAIVTDDCIRCNATVVRTGDLPGIGINADTLSPLRPDGTLTDPNDPSFRIGLLCHSCNTIVNLLADEIGAHADDLLTYFKVVFPHGRYDRITNTDTTQPDTTEQPSEPTPTQPTPDPDEATTEWDAELPHSSTNTSQA